MSKIVHSSSVIPCTFGHRIKLLYETKLFLEDGEYSIFKMQI